MTRTGHVLLYACLALGIIAGSAPLGIAALLHVTGFATVIAYRLDHRQWPIPRGRIAITLSLLIGFIALSCLWAAAGIVAWEKLPEIVAIAASALIIPVAIRDLPASNIRPIQKALLIGLCLGLAVCFGDILLGEPLKRWHKHLEAVPVNAYDREIVVLGLLLWPAGLTLYYRGAKLLALGPIAAFTTCILFLQSHSAMVGMLFGLIVLGTGWVAPRLMRQGLTGLVALGFLLCIPVGFMMAHYGMDHWDNLQFSFRHRVQIWHFTAERILHWPLFGLGLEGSRAIPTGDLPPDFLPLGDNKPPLHPHNVFLQLWLEFGIIGAVLSFTFIASLFRAIDNQSRATRAFMLAAVAAVLAVSSFAFGIWQGWWLATLSFLVSTLLLAARKDALE